MTRANDRVHPVTTASCHDGDGVLQHTAILGLTIREHFAAMAMQGLLAFESLGTVLAIGRLDEYDEPLPNGDSSPLERTVRNAVKYADALLAELERTK